MSTPRFREMTPADIDAVVRIVTDTDEDDGEAAADDFAAYGVDGHVVATLDGDAPIGVSGFRHVPATERTSSLSWTYLAREHRGQGHGRALVEHVVERLRALGCRKVFVKVSDYEDPEDGALYRAAVRIYAALGFERELTALDFYDAGENLMIHGLCLAKDGATSDAERPAIAEERPALEFVGLHEIDDTSGAYTFEWSAPRSSPFSRKRKGFDEADLVLGLENVRRAGGRKVFLTFPSNLPAVHEPLKAAGFTRVGQLDDYYERGLHELHFAHDLSDPS